MLDLLKIPVESAGARLHADQPAVEPHHHDQPARNLFQRRGVGWIYRGAGLLEIVAQDAALGSIFSRRAPGRPPSRRRFGEPGRGDTAVQPRVAMPALSPVVGHARRAGPERAQHDAAQSERDYANGFFVDHYRQIQERWGGWYVTGKRVPARHIGQPAADHREDSTSCRRRAPRWKGSSISVVTSRVQRHRGADGARPPGALQQSRDPRHVGGTAGQEMRDCRGRPDDCRLPVIRRRGADYRWSHRRLVRLRGEVRGTGQERRQGPIAPRARSQDAAAENSRSAT